MISLIELSFLLGCPQPEAPAPTTPTAQAEQPAQNKADAQPAQKEPPPPPPGEGPQKGECEWAGFESMWSQHEGKEQVVLSGKLEYGGQAQGVLLDVLSSDKDILLSSRCASAGDFRVSVPAGLGEVTLVAVVDADFNGPTRNDAVGRLDAVSVGSEDLEGLSLKLAEGGDLGDITLPEPSSVEAGPPPTDGPPPEGPPPEATEGGDEPPPAGGPPSDNPYKSG